MTQPQVKKPAPLTREDKRAQALRDNLRKRKSQQQHRQPSPAKNKD